MKLRRKNRKERKPAAPTRRNNRAVPANRSTFRKLTIFVYIGVLMIGGAYIFINKHVSTSGYELKELEMASEELLEDNKDLELKIIQLQSLAYIEEVSEELALTPSEQVTFVSDGDGAVAFQE